MENEKFLSEEAICELDDKIEEGLKLEAENKGLIERLQKELSNLTKKFEEKTKETYSKEKEITNRYYIEKIIDKKGIYI